MKKLILGATGSIGSSLAKKVIADGGEVHLVGRDKSSLSELASELNSTFTACDVLEENFSDKIFSDIGETPINGLAYCVGSIDLKPVRLINEKDFDKFGYSSNEIRIHLLKLFSTPIFYSVLTVLSVILIFNFSLEFIFP